MASVTIDIGALKHNFEVARRLAPRSCAMAVIKANAYGHGLVTAARALESADALAVARLSEGLTLREAGIKTPIVLLEGVFEREELDAAAAAGFELIVHTAEQIELLRDASSTARFKVWLKLDSGMNRLGFKGDAFHTAYAALSALPVLRGPLNLCTHLSSADLPELPTTAEQLLVFAAATRSLTGERSLARSAALIRFPDSNSDCVGSGMMLSSIRPIYGPTVE